MADRKRVLVTGGFGYVGGRVVDHLKQAHPDWSLRISTSREGAAIPDWAAGCDIVHADVRDADAVARAAHGVHAIVHLASVDEIASARSSRLAIEVNGIGTEHLMQAARAAGVERVVYVSTYHVYGLAGTGHVTESTPARPVHPYAFSHLLGESYVDWYRTTHGVPGVILRLSNAFGYPMDPSVERWSLVFNDCARQAVETGRIALRTSGRQVRDFVTLHDVARAIDHSITGPIAAFDDGLLNLGGEHSMAIREVADLVARRAESMLGREVAVEAPEGSREAKDPTSLRFDSTKLRASGFTWMGDPIPEIDRTLRVAMVRDRV